MITKVRKDRGVENIEYNQEKENSNMRMYESMVSKFQNVAAGNKWLKWMEKGINRNKKVKGETPIKIKVKLWGVTSFKLLTSEKRNISIEYMNKDHKNFISLNNSFIII